MGVLLGSIVVFLLLTLGYEGLARQQGFEPAVRDSMAHWCHWRDQVEPDSLVFIGDSRITAGIDLEVFKAKFPDRKVIQLGIDATKPVALLQHLLQDSSFHGQIVCSFSPNSYSIANLESQQPWIDYYENRWTLSEKFSYGGKRLLDQTFVIRRAEWGITSIISSLARNRSLPKPPHRKILEDRSRLLDFSKVDTKPISQKIAKQIKTQNRLDQDHFSTQFEQSETNLESFLSRGGELVYVVMPVSGDVKDSIAETYPEAIFWNVAKEITKARTIHYLNLNNVDAMTVPDGSHLDDSSRQQFSRSLLKLLEPKRHVPGINKSMP